MQKKKTIKVLSQSEIINHPHKYNEDDLIISFHNTTDVNIVESQKRTFIVNQKLIDMENNIFFLPKDDVQNLSTLKLIRHLIFPYKHIFDKNDLFKIVEFLKSKNALEKNIVINCEFGASRSKTLAIFLEKYTLNETHEIIDLKEKKILNNVIQDIFEMEYSIDCLKVLIGPKKIEDKNIK